MGGENDLSSAMLDGIADEVPERLRNAIERSLQIAARDDLDVRMANACLDFFRNRTRDLTKVVTSGGHGDATSEVGTDEVHDVSNHPRHSTVCTLGQREASHLRLRERALVANHAKGSRDGSE